MQYYYMLTQLRKFSRLTPSQTCMMINICLICNDAATRIVKLRYTLCNVILKFNVKTLHTLHTCNVFTLYVSSFSGAYTVEYAYANEQTYILYSLFVSCDVISCFIYKLFVFSITHKPGA